MMEMSRGRSDVSLLLTCAWTTSSKSHVCPYKILCEYYTLPTSSRKTAEKFLTMASRSEALSHGEQFKSTESRHSVTVMTCDVRKHYKRSCYERGRNSQH